MRVRTGARRMALGWVPSLLLACLSSGCAASGLQEVPSPTATPDVAVVAGGQEEAVSSSGNAEPAAGADGLLFEQVMELDDTQEPGEVDFESAAFQTIRLALSPASSQVAFEARLVDQYGTLLLSDSASQGGSILVDEFTLPYDGVYRLIVTARDGAGAVQVQGFSLDSRTGGAILSGAGDSGAGSFAGPRIYHTFLFTLAQDEVVDILVEPASNSEAILSTALYQPDGALAAAAAGAGGPAGQSASVVGFSAPMTGQYAAIVTNAADAPGAYTFRVADRSSPAGGADIRYGEEYAAELFENSPLSVTFDGTVGDALRVDVIEPERQLDVDIYVYGPYGQVIAYAVDADSGEDEALDEMQLPYTGRYRLELRPSGSGTASFMVNRLAQSGLTGGGVFPDEPGREVLSGRFEAPHVFHSYQFSGQAGDTTRLTITAQALAEELELGVALLGPDGVQLSYASATAGATPTDLALGEWPLSETGTHTIMVYSLNGVPGVYQLGLERERSLRP